LDILSKVLFSSVSKLESRGWCSKFSWGWGPRDGGAFIEEVARVEVLNALGLDTSDAKGLLVLRVELGREDLNGHVSELLLRVNVGIEVRLASLDGSENGFKRMTTLFHITLNLPVEFNIRGDIEVKGEIKKFTDTWIMHRVKTLEDDDRSRFDGFRGVESSVDVVVDRLGNRLS
jgi:hypothetical protein